MDLENTWKSIDEKDGLLENILDKPVYHPPASLHPLRKLRTNLLIGIGWGILITIGYILILFYFPIWQVQSVVVLLIAFNSWLIAYSWILYRKTPSSISPSLTIREEIERNHRTFMRWWKLQEWVGLFVYPFAATGGFFLGGTIGSGKTVEQLLTNPIILWTLLITIVISVPLSFFSARWMFRYAYGKHLDRLKKLLDEISVGE